MKRVLFIFAAALIAGAAPPEVGRGPGPEVVRYGKARKVCVIQNPAVVESSGVAASNANIGLFWTHNDSGDGARLYLFDILGRDCGTFDVKEAKAFDWEDVSSFKIGEKCYVMASDVGDNLRIRHHLSLYIMEEPLVGAGAATRPARGELTVIKRIDFMYAQGSHDCEAVGVDVAGKKVVVITKAIEKEKVCNVYEMALPDLGAATQPAEILKLEPVAKLTLQEVSGLCIAPDGKRMIVNTYDRVLEYTRVGDESWGKALLRAPRRLPTPSRQERPQGEGVCYGVDGKTIFLTNDGERGQKSPMWVIPVEPGK